MDPSHRFLLKRYSLGPCVRVGLRHLLGRPDRRWALAGRRGRKNSTVLVLVLVCLARSFKGSWSVSERDRPSRDACVGGRLDGDGEKRTIAHGYCWMAVGGKGGVGTWRLAYFFRMMARRCRGSGYCEDFLRFIFLRDGDFCDVVVSTASWDVGRVLLGHGRGVCGAVREGAGGVIYDRCTVH